MSEESPEFESQNAFRMFAAIGIRDPWRPGRRFENHVAALDVSPHVRASGGVEHPGEIFHGQYVLAADIDTAKQRDVGHISPMLYFFST